MRTPVLTLWRRDNNRENDQATRDRGLCEDELASLRRQKRSKRRRTYEDQPRLLCHGVNGRGDVRLTPHGEEKYTKKQKMAKTDGQVVGLEAGQQFLIIAINMRSPVV